MKIKITTKIKLCLWSASNQIWPSTPRPRMVYDTQLSVKTYQSKSFNLMKTKFWDFSSNYTPFEVWCNSKLTVALNWLRADAHSFLLVSLTPVTIRCLSSSSCNKIPFNSLFPVQGALPIAQNHTLKFVPISIFHPQTLFLLQNLITHYFPSIKPQAYHPSNPQNTCCLTSLLTQNSVFLKPFLSYLTQTPDSPSTFMQDILSRFILN